MKLTRILSVIVCSFIGVAGAAAQTCADAPAGLISWWTGDGTTDDLLGANNGTPEGGVGYQPGLVGDAFSLDGIDDGVSLPDMNDKLPAGTFTYVAWARIAPGPQQPYSRTILGSYSNGSDDLLMNAGGRFQLHYAFYDDNHNQTCGVTSTSLFPNVDEWTFVAVTFDGQTIAAYMNDQMEVRSCPGGTATRRIRWIGRAAATGRFRGQIDEVAVFNRALSGAELNAIYSADLAGMCKADAIKNIAQQKTTEVVQQIVDLNLHQGIENSLDAKLSGALAALDDMNDQNDIAAINSLQAALNAIEAQRDKKIPSDDADALIAAIREVIDLLSSVI